MTTSTPNQPSSDMSATLGLDSSVHRKRRLLRWLAVLAVLASAGAFAWHHARQGDPHAVHYVMKPVTRGDLVVTISATGTLEPIKQVDVGIEVSGTIKSVDVDYNDQVTVNQVLARLDTSKLEAQVVQSEASRDLARARVLQAQATVLETEAQMAKLDRVFALSGGKMPARADLDAAKASLARAKAEETGARASLAQAEGALNVTRTDLSKAEIHSPIAGVVLTRSVEPGQTVAASLQAPILFTLAEDLAKMELQVDVDEADVGQVKSGQEATFTVDAYPDQTFPARVTQVRFGAETVNGVVTYKTVLAVDNSSLTLRPGMTATAVITVNKVTDALLVPNAALRFSPPAPAVAAPKARSGSLMSSLLPRPPRSQPSKPESGTAGKSRVQQVWTLQAGALAPVPISKGLSDGIRTAASGESLVEGLELVTDIAAVK